MAALASNSSGNAGQHRLLEALFDFEALPGRYPLTLREPRALFDDSHQVLMLAAGRPVKELELAAEDAARAQRAACFFVRMAMLRSGADHYTLLGLPRDFQADTLRDHYRLLMRLTHPDFAGDASQWPRDAATRINQANDVLSSRAQRGEYDRQLASVAPRPMPVNSLAAVLPTPRKPRPVKVKWVWVMGTGAAGAVLLGLSFMLTGSPDVAETSELASTAQGVAVRADEPVPASVPAQASTHALLPTLRIDHDLVVSAPVAPAIRPARVARVRTEDPAPASPVEQALAPRRVEPAAPDPVRAEPAPVLAPVAEPLMVVAPAVVAPTVSVTPVATAAVPASKPARRLSLADAQSAMGELMQAMQAGRGEDLLAAMDRALRRSEGAINLVNAYNLLVGDSRAVRLGPVRLRGYPDADRLVVDGTVQLVLYDQGQPAPVRELRLRALFAQRGGQVVMTDISAGGARP